MRRGLRGSAQRATGSVKKVDIGVESVGVHRGIHVCGIGRYRVNEPVVSVGVDAFVFVPVPVTTVVTPAPPVKVTFWL